MLRLTLAQMRRSLGRLVAAGVAIVIGTAFVTATLIAGDVMTRTTNDSIAAQFADADLVVSAPSDLTASDVEALRSVDGVDAVDAVQFTYLDLAHGAKRVFQLGVPAPSDPRFEALDVVEGSMPTASGQVSLPTSVAERLGVGIGDTVTSSRNVWDDSAPDGGTYEEVRDELTVVGTTDDPYGAYAQMGGAVVVTAQDVAAWEAAQASPDDAERLYSAAMVGLAPGTDLETARADLVAASPDQAEAVTPDEHAQAQARKMTGDQDVFTYVILCFAAVALLVAALVIANTFQVLVAQRTRTLALLRAVGANRSQLARSVLSEATILGVASSLGGILLGSLLTQVALLVARGADLGVPIPATIAVTPAVVLVPLLVGTLVTVVASFAPARAATRVAPLEALRPADAPSLTRGGGRVRLVVASLLTLGGLAVLGGGIWLGSNGSAEAGLLAGVAGGALSFVGVLVGAVYWLPGVVSFVGRLLAGTGSTARLATANTLRNPRRTTATSTALLIGVTLVAMMSTGAASARTSLDAALDDQYPVDVLVATDAYGSAEDAVPGDVVRAVSGTEGVSRVVELSGVTVTLLDGAEMTMHGVDPDQARAVVRSPDVLAAFAPGTVMVPAGDAEAWDVAEGDTLELTGPDGSTLEVTAHVGAIGDGWLLDADDARTLAPDAVVSRLWVGLDDTGDATQVVPAIQDAIVESDTPVEVAGIAVERAAMQSVIDTILGVIVGLLAVAVVIALIGVANTLSLSVIERRRESATLRAIGLSRAQLRWMLAIEGMLIAGVGAVLGIVLGVLYGWAGAATALSVMGDVSLAVPWRDVALVLVVALVAGLVASVVPGRTAARTSPVAALAVD
ncbi:ABC transporter permease [Cellulosimicrobium protaetiae]|uniref:FtsX-like permease family protein n=1 Tax=Cellulosimicrobium protaetiae TaxID=2587808 RepID=A0A6M5UDH0_9MICO|nr:ABC transporter permease [Cellulosimicrobium protaetiae]QJW36074.1 FtsX-like permease family protein [Cellulosimicrobium protaetiae]